MAYVWLNGRMVDEEVAGIPARDGGFLHGAGVFTTMRAARGKVFRLDRHLARLKASCESLGLEATLDDDDIADAVDDLLETNSLSDARLRLTITRGAADLATGEPTPTLLLTAGPFEPYPASLYATGMTVGVVSDQKANPMDVQAGHKTLNYLSRFAALREAKSRGAAEALWFDHANTLQSGSVSNVFLIKAGAVLTPPTTDDVRADESLARLVSASRRPVLPGVMRGAVLDAAKELSIDAKPAVLSINDLLTADEVFLTNSAMRVMPVTRVERHVVGNEKPGPVTQGLMQTIERMSAE
jgi:branched-chain amino acid aminotransferase